MEILARLFPYGKTIAGLKKICEQGHLFVDTSAARARRNLTDTLPSVTTSGGSCGHLRCGGGGGDPCSLLLQTQAAQTVLQRQEAPRMPRMAMLLGIMGIGMSGYSSRQLTLHYKPANHLFR
ncbi:unnamed protein product [Merluccius merluccius]